jgi:hypothetical protein
VQLSWDTSDLRPLKSISKRMICSFSSCFIPSLKPLSICSYLLLCNESLIVFRTMSFVRGNLYCFRAL